MQFARQFKTALLSYPTRPAFLFMLLAAVAGRGALVLPERLHMVHVAPAFLMLVMLLAMLPLVMGLLLIVAFLLQAREQLRGLNAAIVPGFRRVHMAAASLIFFLIVAGLSLFVWKVNPQTSFRADFAMILTVMTLGALATVGSVWWLPVLLSLLFVWPNERFIWLLEWFTIDLSRWPARIYRLHPQAIQEWQAIWAARVALIAVDLLALILLGWLARPRTKPPVSERIFARIGAVWRRKSCEVATVDRRVTSVFARGLHRRLAVRAPGAAWGVAVLLAIVMAAIMFLLLHDQRHTDVLLPLVMATVVPGVVVAIGWRERWPSLGYELLFPSPREQFAREMALALGTNLAEFWLATLIAGVAVLALWEPGTVVRPQFAVSVLASALMQVFLFGVILWLARWRSWLLYLVGIIVLFQVVMVPMMDAWSDRPVVTPVGLLLIAGLEAAAGIGLALSGRAAWRRAEFA
jgi:hypothetical protein